jgi:uncharacterized membrane protein YedE/YeeE
MSAPTPVQSFLGGLSMALPVHALLILNGSIFGVSGFLHRAAQLSSAEAVSALAGFILGGVAVGVVEGTGPEASTIGLGPTILAGLLVGLGTKVSRNFPTICNL